MEIEELIKLPKGTVFHKGKRKRIFIQVVGNMVQYQQNSRNYIYFEHFELFKEWMKGAEIA